MSYYAIVTTLKDVRKHPNADRLQLADVFGNTVCVSLDYTEGQLGVYFPTGGQLSVKFAEANNLLRKKDAEGNNIGGYMDPDKRNVTAIKLRGEKSDGLFLPLHCLETFGDISTLRVGDRIDVFNGEEICTKYIPRTQARRGHVSDGNRTRKFKARKFKAPIAPTFAEHADTEQLAYNLGAFKVGDELEFSLKMHGTSQRTGHLKVLTGYKRSIMDRILRRPGKPVYDWGYVSGTRRVVLDTFDGGFYGSNEFRKQHHDAFVGKLWKGETVYYEVVGFTHTGAPIMGNGNNEKLGKDFVKQYGKETVFSYGCDPRGYEEQYGQDYDGQYAVHIDKPISDVYVYRMTMTNEDGEVVEYTPDFMRYRCEQMGVKTVLVFGKATLSEDRLHFTAPNGYDHDYLIGDGELEDMIMRCAEDYFDGPDPVGKTHTREGVVVRIVNRPKFAAFKHKNFSFKVLEGIISEKLAESTTDVAEDVLAEM